MPNRFATLFFVALALASAAGAAAQEARIVVHADRTVHPISRYLTGAVHRGRQPRNLRRSVQPNDFRREFSGTSEQHAGREFSRLWRAVQRGRPPALGPSNGSSFRGKTMPADHIFGRRRPNRRRKPGAKPLGHVVASRANLMKASFGPVASNLANSAWPWKPGDGSRIYAQQRLHVAADAWQRLTFTLTPNATDAAGRFAITLQKPGSVALGYAFLQPGPWGRFKGLPVRRDVVEGLVDQGITVLRYGGSMVNHPEYRWKKMIGPRDRRPPYPGCWYPYSSNGWGILDFLDFCEAAGFLAIPAFNMDETPAGHGRLRRIRQRSGRPAIGAVGAPPTGTPSPIISRTSNWATRNGWTRTTIESSRRWPRRFGPRTRG